MSENPGMALIHAELNGVHPGMRRIFNDTIEYTREMTTYLLEVVCDHWDELKVMTSTQQTTRIEQLVHKTKDNPKPAYPDFDARFKDFPSMLRRAVIRDAVGHVQAHETLCDNYYADRDKVISSGNHYTKMEPGFTFTPKKFPTLYKDHMFRLDKNTVQIKVWKNRSWQWIDVKISAQDLKSIVKAQDKGAKFMNPSLVFDYDSYYLTFPVDYSGVKFPDTPLDQQVILAIDRGFNHGAVCSVMTASGQILARYFDPFSADMARIDHVINEIRKAQKQTGTGNSVASLFTKLEGLKDNYVKQLSRWIVDLAIKHNVYGIVLEHLGKMKGHGSLKARLHHWRKQQILKMVKGMAFREGIRTFQINPKGTSMYAFDGSGKVTRDEKDYSQCTFQNGKRYNCDLSASYNIGARYYLRAYSKSIPETEWSQLKAKVPGLEKRTTWVLATLRALDAELHPVQPEGE